MSDDPNPLSPADPQIAELVNRVESAFASDAVPKIYFNGFTNSLTHADVVTVLERNGRPVAVLNMSYTTAKTLAVKLGQVLARFEEEVGRPMLITDEVSAALEKGSGERK